MSQVTLKGNPFNTIGNLPKVGSTAPDFKLTKSDLSEATLNSYAGKRKVLNIFPDRKSTRLNSSHSQQSRMPSSA